ncbi:MAG: hypothetical protein GC186_00125 [Rhodobacteraceae bacterium]|nr:hypothetical protein [Paracoccaceae bacterium]
MVMSPKERKKAERERRARESRSMPDSSYPYLTEPFFAWRERTEGNGDWDSATFHLDAAGITPPEFLDDSGPDWMKEYPEADEPDGYSPYTGRAGSIGRIEAYLEHMIAASANIAVIINRYKREQLNARIKELEQSNLGDQQAKKKAFDDIVHLRKMLDHLDRMTAERFSVWELKGI